MLSRCFPSGWRRARRGRRRRPRLASSPRTSACSRPRRRRGPSTSTPASCAATSPRAGRAFRSSWRCRHRRGLPPRAGARVDVWHCDAAGDYSGVRQPRRRQHCRRDLPARHPDYRPRRRGTLRDDLAGLVSGRTPHIHFKVFLDDSSVLTSQLFFPDGSSEALYRSVEPYVARGAPDTPNARDGIARRAGPAAMAEVSGDASGMTAALVVGVDPTAARLKSGPRRAAPARRHPRLASMVILALRTFETGQPALALLAASAKASGVAPGIFALTVKCTAVIAKPPSAASTVT